MSKVGTAVVADDLDAAAVPLHADVTFLVGVEALVKGIPTAVFEFGPGGICRPS